MTIPFGARARDQPAARALLAEALELANQAAGALAQVNIGRDLAWAEIDHDVQTAARGFTTVLHQIIDTGMLFMAARTCQQAAVLLERIGRDDSAALIIGRVGLSPLTQTETNRYAQVEQNLKERLANRYNDLSQQGTALTLYELLDATASALATALGPEHTADL